MSDQTLPPKPPSTPWAPVSQVSEVAEAEATETVPKEAEGDAPETVSGEAEAEATETVPMEAEAEAPETESLEAEAEAPATASAAAEVDERDEGLDEHLEFIESEEMEEIEQAGASDQPRQHSPPERAAPPPVPVSGPLSPDTSAAVSLPVPGDEPTAGSSGAPWEEPVAAMPGSADEEAPASGADEPRAATSPSPLEEALEAARSVDSQGRLDALLGEMAETTEAEWKAVLCYEMGEVQEGTFGDEPSAIKSYSKALGLDNQLFPNLWAVRRVFWRRQLWPNLIKLIDAELKLVSEPAHRVSLLMEKGDILRRHQDDPEGGLVSYQEAHAADPVHLGPILALEKMYRQRGQTDALFATMEAHVAATEDSERKAALLLSLAQLEEQLPDASYERRRGFLLKARLLTAHPGRVLEELDRMARREDRLEDLLEVIELRKQAWLGEEPNGVQVTPRVDGGDARASEGEGSEAEETKEEAGSPVGEVSSGVEPASEKEPEIGAGDKPPSGEAAEPASRDIGLAPTLMGVVPARFDVRRLEAAYAQTRLQVRLLEKAGQPERAWEMLLPWRERLPEHSVLRGELRSLAARLGKWDALAELLVEELAGASAASRPGLLLERALVLQRAGRGEEATPLLRGLTEGARPHPVGLALMELSALVEDDAEAQIEILGRVLDSLDALARDDSPEDLDDWRAELWTQRALLLLEAGEGTDRVREACRAARAAAPGYAPATDLLETLLLQEKAYPELLALYKLELVGASQERALHILEALVEIQTVWHPQPEGRIDALLQLTVLLPDSISHRLRLISALAESGRPEDLLTQIRTTMALIGDMPELAAELALQAARVAVDRLKDDEQAIDFLNRGLDACPGHAELAIQLEAVLREAGRLEDLVALYRSESSRTLDDAHARRLLLQLAWVLERDLERPAEAAEVYDQLWQRAPQDWGALALLVRALRALGDHGRLSELLELQADSAAELRDRAVLFRLLAEHYWDRLEDDRHAEAAYLRARACDPESSDALHGLAKLALLKRDWGKAAEVLDELSRGALPNEVRRRVLLELAWLAEGPGADLTAASEHWMELATLDPPVQSTFWAAVRLAVSRQDWGAAAGALDWLAGLAEKAGELDLVAALTCRAALYGRVAGVSPGPRLVKAVQMDAGSDLALVLSTDLAVSEGHEPADRLRRRLKAATPPEHRGAFDLTLAVLLEREGRVREAAALLGGRLAGTAADLPHLLLLRHLALRVGDGALQAELSLRIAACIGDDHRAAVILREGAAAAPEPAVAVRLLGKALKRVPRDGLALVDLVSHLVDLGRFKEAVEVISYWLSGEVSREESLALRWQRANLCVSELGDPRAGAVDLFQILRLDPEHTLAMALLARLQAEDGAYEEAAELLRQRLELGGQEDAGALRPIRTLLAEVLERSGRPVDEVLEPLEAILLDSPGDVDALERKHAVLLRRRDFAAAVAVIDERYRSLAEPRERALGELRKAAIYRDLAANDEEVRRALEAARDLDPVNREAILGLLELYRRFEDKDALVMVLSSGVDAVREQIRRSASIQTDQVRFLFRLFKESGSADGQLFSLGVLEVLGDLERGEAAQLKRLRGSVVEGQPGRLTAELWTKFLLHPLALGGQTELWELIGSATYQMWPEDLAAYGVGRGERVAAKNVTGVVKEVFDLASYLGVVLEEVYLGGNRPTQVHGVATPSGAAIVVGGKLGPRLSTEERHRVGALLAGVRLGTLALGRITPEEAELLVASAIREGQPNYWAHLPSERVDEVGKRLRKALSRKDRKALPLSAINAAGGEVDLPRWRLGIARTLARVGLLCSGDIGVSVDTERATGEVALVAEDADAERELMLFALSGAHLELRLHLGVAR